MNNYRGNKFSIATATAAVDPFITVPTGKKAVLHHIFLQGTGAALVDKAASPVTYIPALNANTLVNLSNVHIRTQNAGTNLEVEGADISAAVFYTIIDA